MEWINNLFFGGGVAHSILLIALVIAVGIALGKIKIAGISLGITWILFVGIALSHFGMRIDPSTLHFVKEFGLILFVYSIGLQVGPSFFSSLKKGGLTLNMLASAIVFLGVAITYVLHVVTGIPITTMVGILSGAVTNTPGLGAAQQAYSDMTGINDPSIPLGYAVAYPLGVIGIIVSIMAMRVFFRIKLDKEAEAARGGDSDDSGAQRISIVLENPAIAGRTVGDISGLIDRTFVLSRVCHADGRIEIASNTTQLNLGDKLFVIAAHKDEEALVAFLGHKIDMDFSEWEKLDSQFIARRVMITKPELNGKRLGDLRLRSTYGINITRVNRAGVDLVANRSLQLQMGDRVTVVGTETGVAEATKVLGNSMRRLREPNLIPIFVGIFLGVFLGSIPILLPGIPQPLKLGLAGGPLIVSILISRFGPQYKVVTYTTMSANLMLREIGIALFLAGVGLGAGEGFVETIVDGGGYKWVGYGVIITMVPLLLVGIIGRLFYKINYFTLAGLLAGSMTDPPALAYSNAVAGNDLPAVSYATVYPLTMFLRILTAQLLILFAAA
ncbi:MAG TPA: putative transporter [Candidatus Rikenella faecigallinarum]|uniref:Transporter n=1 Tax=Candidatus Rikenella faecigallinarum TaxID=2838745 RepID=A0A9D1QEH6_9BACT|nr:putative transporter [Candidatus Rikenella faecigallinarum]